MGGGPTDPNNEAGTPLLPSGNPQERPMGVKSGKGKPEQNTPGPTRRASQLPYGAGYQHGGHQQGEGYYSPGPPNGGRGGYRQQSNQYPPPRLVQQHRTNQPSNYNTYHHPQSYQEGYPTPPHNYYPYLGYQIPTHNRYAPLMEYESNGYYNNPRSGPPPFLGHRGRGGRGTPRGNTRPVNNRGAGRNGMDQYSNWEIQTTQKRE